ncbi:MAG: NifU family protein [Acidimicrobiia bacterium]|nr:NifU family protein [Acidimicrobiia bacterium]
MPIEQRIISITDEALRRVLEVRAEEEDSAELALGLAVAGPRGRGWEYRLTLMPLADAAEDDAVGRYGELPVVIPHASIPLLQGAGLRADGEGLALDNPNRPPAEPWWPGDDAPLEARVSAVLDHEINPSIAGHGGFAQLAEVEGSDVYLSLGGGCQGCGMAQVTLRQGIEVALRHWCPEVGAVLDVTDHASGENPYY